MDLKEDTMKDKPYRPSNGTEGDMFQEKFCEKCVYDDYDNDVYCEILGDSMAFNVDDKEYPKEWTYDKNGCPTCTAFNTE